MAGIGAAVLGLLAAAFHDPVWTEGIRSSADIAIAAVGFGLLAIARIHALWIVLWCVVGSIGVRLLG